MMNDEMNTPDEFEDWLKQSADKHRIYPSDKLWRNINEQLHEQPNWPALTFGAILTLALITATLVFLHPTNNLFTTPDYARNSTLQSPVNTTTAQPSGNATQLFVRAQTKKSIYAFNSPVSEAAFGSGTATLPNEQTSDLADLTPVYHSAPEPVASPLQQVDAEVASNHLSKVTVTVADSSITPAAVTDKQADVVGNETNPSEKELLTTTASSTVRLPTIQKKRWHLEVYGGSNISYRRLNESNQDNHATYSQSAVSNGTRLNNMISQSPSVGINAGLAFVYAVSDRVHVKAGVQFNYRQYTIDAYKSRFERSVLLLNNGFYYPDSVYTYSAISNEQGKAFSLSNRYYQVGIPVGVEWTAVELPNLHFNIAANLQPTYQINSNNYLLTSDYKSYVQAPGLLRRINMNAGMEATANFTAGALQWQVGPQVLYQTLPTQKANYSIHEHLIDYGIRVGIIKKL